MSISIDQQRLKDIFDCIPSDIKTTYFNAFIVGGAARYITKKTDVFKDIDIAVVCNATYECYLLYRSVVISEGIVEEKSKAKSFPTANDDIEKRNIAKNPASMSEWYGFEDNFFYGHNFKYKAVEFDLFPIRDIRKYIERVPTAWDGIGIYIKDPKHYIHSKDYLSELNYQITDRGTFLFSKKHLESQGFLTNAKFTL